MKTHNIAALIFVSLVFSSCSKPVQEKEPAPAPPEKFAFTDTNIVVAAKDLEDSNSSKNALSADFNQDGLSDLAIIKKEGDIQNKVEIYIQKKPEPAAEGDAASRIEETSVSFFKGGTIERPIEGKITGIASAVEDKLVNIVILVTHSNMPNEWIQYRNDGETFKEVDF